MSPFRPALVAVLCALLALPARAHERQVHADLIDVAYQLLIFAGSPQSGLLTTAAVLPPGVTQADADALRLAMAGAPAKFAKMKVTLAARAGCASTPKPWQWAVLGNANAALHIDYTRGECLRSAWVPGGILDNTGSVRFAGPALGYFAAHADDEQGDTQIWIRPTNTGALGIGPGPATRAANEALNVGLTVVFLPFVCLADFIAGNTGCVSNARDLAGAANPIDDLAGLVPGIEYTNHREERLIGFWHHINVVPARNNEFDDDQGYLLDSAGPTGVPDALEVGMMAGFDLLGFSLNYDGSNGPKQYEVLAPKDGLRATRHRSKGEWQSYTISHTAMEPLDNLALYGWTRFLASKDAADLEWPLHALGDAVSPMHTVGSPGWGHAPFEQSIEVDWKKIRHLEPYSEVEQRAQVKRIFTSALKFRKQILDWQRARSSKEVPVRAVIRSLAVDTYTASMATMATAGWPFSPTASAEDVLGGSTFYHRPDNAALARPILENGIGAAVAFLVSVAEEIP